MHPDDEHPFAPYVRILGRGPGRSRSLTRDEASEALGFVLRGDADPVQVGAFLMLLRYRGEDPAEMAGLVEAARASFGAGPPPGCPPVALDWPSYGAGRTRAEPWFLLAALALARTGISVLMHGSNAFSEGMPVEAGLAELGLAASRSPAEAARHLAAHRFAYLPLPALSPELDRLLGLRRMLGLRSPINTAVRLLNPFDAPASVDGVFHPAYLEVHLRAAELLGRRRLAVLKGGGGEAERNPDKAVPVHVFDRERGRAEVVLERSPASAPAESSGLRAAWESGAGLGAATARATIALALLALGRAEDPASAEAQADTIWSARLEAPVARTA